MIRPGWVTESRESVLVLIRFAVGLPVASPSNSPAESLLTFVPFSIAFEAPLSCYEVAQLAFGMSERLRRDCLDLVSCAQLKQEPRAVDPNFFSERE
jgi:hypothetical protein